MARHPGPPASGRPLAARRDARQCDPVKQVLVNLVKYVMTKSTSLVQAGFRRQAEAESLLPSLGNGTVEKITSTGISKYSAIRSAR